MLMNFKWKNLFVKWTCETCSFKKRIRLYISWKRSDYISAQWSTVTNNVSKHATWTETCKGEPYDVCYMIGTTYTELFFNLDVGVTHVLPPHFELHARNFSSAWNAMSSGQTILVWSVPIVHHCASFCISKFSACVYYPGSFLLVSIFIFGTSCSACFMKLFSRSFVLVFLHSFTVRCEEMLHLPHIMN